MYGLGTITNIILIIVGSAIGLLMKKAIPERLKESLVQALALCTFSIGIMGVITAAVSVDGKFLSSNYTIIMVICMALGTFIGELINIEKRLDSLGEKMQKRFSSPDSSFAQGFVSTSLIFCVGSMAILGSINDGLKGDPTILITKGLLDGTVSIVFASTMGIGVMFSAISVGIYQGLITVCASLLAPYLTQEVVAQMSLVGSILIMAIGLNFLYKPKIRLGNMLPAMFLPLIYFIFQGIFERVF